MYSDVSKNDARPPVTATPPLRNPERDPPASTPPPPRPENRAQIRYFSPLGKLQKKGINYTPRCGENQKRGNNADVATPPLTCRHGDGGSGTHLPAVFCCGAIHLKPESTFPFKLL